jgi:hypothetical protein
MRGVCMHSMRGSTARAMQSILLRCLLLVCKNAIRLHVVTLSSIRLPFRPIAAMAVDRDGILGKVLFCLHRTFWRTAIK